MCLTSSNFYEEVLFESFGSFSSTKYCKMTSFGHIKSAKNVSKSIEKLLACPSRPKYPWTLAGFGRPLRLQRSVRCSHLHCFHGMLPRSQLLHLPREALGRCPKQKEVGGCWWIWRFPEIGVPPNHPFLDGIFQCTPTIFGVPPFMEPPISFQHQ